MLLTFSAYSKKVEVIRSGGSDDPHPKYNFVEEEHNTGLFIENEHTLRCHDPGTLLCAWVNQPYIDANSDITYVENQIASGNLSGSVVINGRTLTWSGTDVKNFTLIVDIP